MKVLRAKLDLRIGCSFGHLFRMSSEPGRAYLYRSAAPGLLNSDTRGLKLLEHQFCSEGNGVSAAISAYFNRHCA